MDDHMIAFSFQNLKGQFSKKWTLLIMKKYSANIYLNI